MVNTIIGEEFVTLKVQVVGYIILYFQVYAQLLLPLRWPIYIENLIRTL